ncbi:MAG: multidrug effflux MFS transporter [Gammaproteobacteria bacterium]|nr:multidrug effflux MFS transporter [Gammaproteobacteria bacterium]
MNPANFRLIIGVLVLASSVSIMSTDIYAPSLPHLPALFDTNAGMVKLTISLNVLMFGIGQMFHGPLSDRFGRKPVLLAAIALFTVSSFACALAQSIEQLILARMLQGFMGAAEAVVGMAIFRDLFDEKQQVRALAIFGMSIALGPAVAPIIGGYVHIWLGWRANFYLIGAAGILATVLIWKLLPESAAPDAGALKLSRVIGNYAALLSDKKFITYAAMVGIGMGIIYAFITGAPFILISQLGIATEKFGYYQAFIVGAYFIGSLVSMRLAGRMPTGRLLGIGLALVLAGGGAFLILALLDAITPASFAGSFAVMTLGLGPVFAVAPARAMLSTTRSAGSAAAMLGACEMLIGGLAAGAVSLLHGDTVWPVGIPIMCLMLAVAALAWRATRLARPAATAA